MAVHPFAADIGTSDVFDSGTPVAVMNSAIARVCANGSVVGPAFTVECASGDNLALHRALDIVPADHVLVVATTTGTERVYMGDLIAQRARSRNVKAIILDGHIRDADQVSEKSLPVYARGSRIDRPSKQNPGRVNVPVCCGGVEVASGDVIVADGDGVLVLAQSVATEGLHRAAGKRAGDLLKAQSIRRGASTLDLIDKGPVE